MPSFGDWERLDEALRNFREARHGKETGRLSSKVAYYLVPVEEYDDLCDRVRELKEKLLFHLSQVKEAGSERG